jgi:hypothetical protein
MMSANIGSGDGECGNWMLWIGSPVVGGGGVAPTEESAAGCNGEDEPTGIAANAGREGVGMISEITGPEAGSAGIPPYPGMP